MSNSTDLGTGFIDPPPGIIANFVNPENQIGGLIVLHTLTVPITTLCVAIRLYTRKFISGGLLLDDYSCTFAWCLNIVYVAAAEGLTVHFWDLPKSQFVPAFEPFILGATVYYVLVGMIKLTCLLFYRNIFSSSHRTFYFVNAGIVMVIIAYSGMFFTQLFGCIPVEKAWDVWITGGSCAPNEIVRYLSAAVNASTDFYVLIVPIPAVWALPVDTKRKIKVITVFSMGLIACTFSLIRLGFLHNLDTSDDITWEIGRTNIWSHLEISVGLVCVCALVFPAFLKRHWPKRLNQYLAYLIPCRFTRKEESLITVSGISGDKRYSPTGEEWVNNGFCREDVLVDVDVELKVPESVRLGGKGIDGEGEVYAVNKTRKLSDLELDLGTTTEMHSVNRTRKLSDLELDLGTTRANYQGDTEMEMHSVNRTRKLSDSDLHLDRETPRANYEAYFESDDQDEWTEEGVKPATGG
ncbi:hypothetical protein G7Y89_g2032 [Cudoniella acicularis]|uniref:Rhodopsin domain-containing protein n=1 Tax=Cudoniella acicularis TaxID=354080 RepID=A0A8H4W6V8_9HELO|nr:hypothetical protein G7Y89_g2032 [Cudoniella acicularis]